MSKEIQLTKGKFAIVDDDNYEFLNQWKWYASETRNEWYAVRRVYHKEAPRRFIFMHREIAKAGSGFDVDHINGNGLDNRRENLRVCTHADNIHNGRVPKNNTSGYKGVTWNKNYQKWTARISLKRKGIFLGNYSDKIDAARAYNNAAKKYFGKFARLNEMTDENKTQD